MDEGLPEIDKSEAMQKQIYMMAIRLSALEHKIDAIAKHLGVGGSEIAFSAEDVRRK